MGCKQKDLFVILWGLNDRYYFMSENSDFARLYLRVWIKKYNMKGIFSLYKVDKNSFLNAKKDKLYYLDCIYEEDEKVTEIKERYKKCMIERDKVKQIKLLFNGSDICLTENVKKELQNG